MRTLTLEQRVELLRVKLSFLDSPVLPERFPTERHRFDSAYYGARADDAEWLQDWLWHHKIPTEIEDG